MNYKKIEYSLLLFTINPESPEYNYELAICYDEIGQTASAISHYLRCAERIDDKTIQYECMILAGMSIKKQGYRLYTEKSFFQNAISILPERPEAHFLISETLFKLGRQHDAFSAICIAESCHDRIDKNLILTNVYSGISEIKYKKHLYAKSCGLIC